MKNQRLKQIGLSFCVVLSLLVSSISACACLHHREKTIVESSCHEHSEMPLTMEMPDETSRADITQNALSRDSHCNCVKFAPKVYSKSELVKIEKQTAKISSPVEIKIQRILEIPAVLPANFFQTSYLSDSSYNIKSPRAPPRL